MDHAWPGCGATGSRTTRCPGPWPWLAALLLVEPTSGASSDLVADDSGQLVEQLVALVGAIGAPVAIVLDQLEALSSTECRDAVAAFALAVPPGVQLVLASREELPLRDGPDAGRTSAPGDRHR